MEILWLIGIAALLAAALFFRSGPVTRRDNVADETATNDGPTIDLRASAARAAKTLAGIPPEVLAAATDDADSEPIDIEVVGESFANADGSSRQEIIARCAEGEAIVLVREPNNPRDRNAIRVLRASTREQIGYVGRDDAEDLAASMDRGIKMGARIVSLGRAQNGLLGVGMEVWELSGE